MFSQKHPTHLSNTHYPLAPMLVTLTYNGSIQIPSSQSQRPYDTSIDVFLRANNTHFLRPNPVCTHTPISCLPVYSVLATQGVYLSYGSDSAAQNQEPDAPSDPSPFMDQLLQTVHLQSHLAFDCPQLKDAMGFGYFTRLQHFLKIHDRS